MLTLSQGIETLSGAIYDYTNPENSRIPIEDIAVALGNMCRYTGQINQFYPVAQHLVNTSHIVEAPFALTAHCHDVSEGVLGDVNSPLKSLLPDYRDIETRVEASMAKQYGFQFPFPPAVKLADLQMLGLEMKYIKKTKQVHKVLEGIEFEHLLPLVDLSPWTPRYATQRWLDRYNDLLEGGSL